MGFKLKHVFKIFTLVLFFTTAAVQVISAIEGSDTSPYGLSDHYLMYYTGEGDGGLAHITYRTMTTDSEAYQKLSPEEQAKVGKIQANALHSTLFTPDLLVAGHELTGTLSFGERTQNVTLKLPNGWNGTLIVAGTPGFRNEYANEAVFVPWLLEAGYAVVSGNKGLPGGFGDMLTGNHPTRYWGMMMMDLARWSKGLLGENVKRVYAVGLSNGGYQVRRALELDHEAVNYGGERMFAGGLDWSGAYWPDARVMDTNGDHKVSIVEYAAADTLVGTIDKGTLSMGWAYSEDTLTTPAEFAKTPAFPGAQGSMTGAGFTPESSIYWGYYNTNFDSFKAALPGWQGVGYYNLISYVYRAELLGDDAAESLAYSCFYDPENPDTAPPLYQWLAGAENGGWNEESVKMALLNANTGEFSAPLLTIHGEADALLGLESNAAAYANAVEKYGEPTLHRLYIIENAGHVDANADGTADFDFDGTAGNERTADKLTPMQAYVERTFSYLVDWVENSTPAPAGTTVQTNPAEDVTNSNLLSW